MAQRWLAESSASAGNAVTCCPSHVVAGFHEREFQEPAFREEGSRQFQFSKIPQSVVCHNLLGKAITDFESQMSNDLLYHFIVDSRNGTSCIKELYRLTSRFSVETGHGCELGQLQIT